ncbi:unnamed protein product, partial [Iphiclides podalirius]
MKISTVFPYALLFISLPIHAEFLIREKVRRRNTVIKVDGDAAPPCYYNNSLFKNVDSLKRIVAQSKYIFTGKISSVHSKRRAGKSRGNIFKVFVRRVLKGDIEGLSDLLNFETRTSNSSSRAFVFAEGTRWRKCGQASRGWAAILFSGNGFASPLKLLVDPVPSALERVRRVKVLIRGVGASAPLCPHRSPRADKMRPLRHYEPPILASTCKFLCENTPDKPEAWAEEMRGADAVPLLLVRFTLF